MPTIYIDTDDLLTATAAYLDSDLTTKAPDGYYRYDGVIYREQSGGVLLPPADCPEPPIASGVTVTTPASLGTYRVRVNVGTATGMMILVVSRSDDWIVPKLIYDGTTYRSFYCADLSGSPYGGIFNSNNACNAPGSTCLPGTPDPVVLPQWQYNKALATWLDTGSLDSGWITTTGISIAAVDNMYLFVNKTTATPTYVDVEVTKYCSLGAMGLVVNGPTTLTLMSHTDIYSTSVEACEAGAVGADYLLHNGAGADPGPGDFIFLDNGTSVSIVDTQVGVGYGATFFFKIISSNKVVEIFNGYVISITDC